MRMNQALVAELKGAGTDAGEEVYPAPLPAEATLPAVTYQRISFQPLYAYSEGDTGFNRSRWQLDIWAKSKAEAEDLAKQIRVYFSGFSGMMGGVDGVEVGYVFLENELDDFDPEPGRYRIVQDWLIQFNEGS